MMGAGGQPRPGRGVVIAVICVAGLLGLSLIVAPMLMFASSGALFESGAGCSAAKGGNTGQPPPSQQAVNSIPANYLAIFKATGRKYGIPWVILAGIAKVESNDGQTTLPGVHSGSNAFGAAGPMQIGIGGAAGDTWGGAPVHPASERVSGVATDANHDGVASVYEPADAIAGAAKYLLEHGVLDNVSAAIFAYNHLETYVQTVLNPGRGTYANGGFTVSPVTRSTTRRTACPASVRRPTARPATAIAFAEQQLGKPYQWGGTGPDAFDCSGLVMEAYRAAGVDIPRTSQQQWIWGPRVPRQPGPAGGPGILCRVRRHRASPGHVGLVIGGGFMIEAFATGFPIRIAPYGDRDPVGFTRPWAHHGIVLAGLESGG